jgi:hypothetical protein
MRLFYSDKLNNFKQTKKFLPEQSADFPLETSFQDVEEEHCPDAMIVQSL